MNYKLYDIVFLFLILKFKSDDSSGHSFLIKILNCILLDVCIALFFFYCDENLENIYMLEN